MPNSEDDGGGLFPWNDEDDFDFDYEPDYLGGTYTGSDSSTDPLATQINTNSLQDLRNQVSVLDDGLENTREDIDGLSNTINGFSDQLEAMEDYLGDMNQTLESRELNIHLMPPGTNISRLSVQIQLVVGTFVAIVSLGRFFLPNYPFTYVGLAFGGSIVMNLITNKLYPQNQQS